LSSSSNHRPIQAIALDLDGTLLTQRGRPSQKTIDALQAHRKAGTRIVLASGRMTNRMLPIADMLGGPLTLIAYNGARLVEWQDSEHQTKVHNSEISNSLRESIIRLCHEKSLFLNVYTGNDLYGFHPLGDYRSGDIYHSQNGAEYIRCVDNPDLLPIEDVAKLLIVTEPKDREALYLECASRFGGLASIVKSNPEYLEFMAPGVNKGTTLRMWMQNHHIDPKHVAAFGDAENDFDMLQSVGLGIAVANGTPGLLRDMQSIAHVSRSTRISLYSNEDDVIVRELDSWRETP
jgi:Cof subfamily protein (haloacid dehalogenase superfamily)